MIIDEERIILADTPVRFDVAPAQTRDGVVYAQMAYDGQIFYILKYQAGYEAAFVMRLAEQFKVIRGHDR